MDPLAPPLSWKALSPDFGALLKLLGSRTPFHERSNISGADAGQETDKHLFAIEVIARTGIIPSPLDWHPREVLMNYRWREPEEREKRERQEAHAGRAFACAVLLRAACDEANADFVVAEIEDVQRLCESVMVLGKDVEECGCRFLAQCAYEPDALDELHPYVALGALALCMDRATLDAELIASCTQYVNTLCDLYRRPRHRHWGRAGETAQEQSTRYGPLMDLIRQQFEVGMARKETAGAHQELAQLHKRLFGA